ncbi:MAG: DNA double-strand break repair nuclease NurA [Bacillus sp. (in: Bacteria)]|nr:DNA double-strand break repair nuclease NurA [Bacillus sp. (in: firmicutes)]
MPYENQYADKSSHSNLIKSPDVHNFLARCQTLTEPSLEEAERLATHFKEVDINHEELPESIVAVDGSLYEASIDEFLPSTKIGYVKIGSLLINLSQFRSLRTSNNKFVNPFAVAKLQENNDSIPFPLPSANVILEGFNSVRDSFRAEVDKRLYEYRIDDNDPNTSLRTTLFHLASRRPVGDKDDQLGTNDPDKLYIHKCPNENCDEKKIEVLNIEEQQTCPKCKEPIFPSDCLRLWEEVYEYQSNTTALSRFMQVVEHLIPIHYIRCLYETGSLSVIGKIAFIVDGPLAIFGPPAWLHATILKFIHDINNTLREKNYEEAFIMGIQKTGQVVEYMKLIDKYIPKNRIFAVSDDFRYKYISPGREKAKNGYGYETYYGQDIVYKTSTNRTFVFNLIYPFPDKSSIKRDSFIQEKSNLNNYKQLNKALNIIREFEFDLYENAVIPVALAHRYTAISLKPGGKVLDLLTKSAFNNKR